MKDFDKKFMNVNMEKTQIFQNSCNMTSNVTQGHIRPLLSFLAHSFIDDFDENFDECYYHIKTKKFHQII